MPTHIVQLNTGQTVHLGRRPPPPGIKVLRVRDYLLPGGPPPPTTVDFASKAMKSINQMYGNDQWGDCVIAGKMHGIGVWTGNDSGVAAVGTTAEAVASYHAICGPGDQGCVIVEVLDVMKTKGLTVGGQKHTIEGYVAFDWTNQLETQTATYLFGGGCIGINLPQAWMNAPAVWDVTNTSIIGGHDVQIVAYNPQGVVIATWGGTRTITWAAFLSDRWIDEAYCMLSPDWYGKDGVTPLGVDVATLRADLALIGQGVVPPIPSPGPTPTPTPIPTPEPTPVPVTTVQIDPATKTVTSPAGFGMKFVKANLGKNAVTVDFKTKQVTMPATWKGVTA